MSAQAPDLLLALSTMTVDSSGDVSAPTFSLPSPRHGCVGGYTIKTCRECAGSVKKRCGKCSGKGYLTSSCAVCLASMCAAMDVHARDVDDDDDEQEERAGKRRGGKGASPRKKDGGDHANGSQEKKKKKKKKRADSLVR